MNDENEIKLNKPKKLKPDKTREFLKRLEQSKEFRDWVEKIRNKFGVDINGNYEEQLKKLDWVYVQEQIHSFFKGALIGEFLVLFDFHDLILINYLLTGKFEYRHSAFGCIFAELNTPIDELRQYSKKGVGIFILPHASQRDILKFIKENWYYIEYFNKNDFSKGKKVIRKDVEKLSRIAGINLSAIRKRNKEKIHKKIYELYKQGFVKSDGTINLKKAFNWAELGLSPQNPDNVKKIIHTQ